MSRAVLFLYWRSVLLLGMVVGVPVMSIWRVSPLPQVRLVELSAPYYQSVEWYHYDNDRWSFYLQAPKVVLRSLSSVFVHQPRLVVANAHSYPGWQVKSDWADMDMAMMYLYGDALLHENVPGGGVLQGQSFWYRVRDGEFWAHGHLRYERGAMVIAARQAQGSLHNAQLHIDSTQARVSTGGKN